MPSAAQLLVLEQDTERLLNCVVEYEFIHHGKFCHDNEHLLAVTERSRHCHLCTSRVHQEAKKTEMSSKCLFMT